MQTHKAICKFCHQNFTDKNLLNEHLVGCIHKIESLRMDEAENKMEKSHFEDNFEDLACNRLRSFYNEFSEHVKVLEEKIKMITPNTEEKLEYIEDNIVITEKDFEIMKKFQNEIDGKLSVSEERQIVFEEDSNKLSKKQDNLNQQLEIMKNDESKLNEDLKTISKTLSTIQNSQINLEERIANIENVSYNGNLIWKINNIRDKIQEAITGRQPSISSPPFYTSKTGYKMCVKLYLNGDGLGRGTHISMFFSLMKGEYDALLRWPFRQKITFILFDQLTYESRENVIDSFRPDPNSNSFKRPTNEINIASGIPLFCSLETLFSNNHEYIKNDCLFLKIIVDSRDLIDA